METDYRKLQRLLATQQFKAADQETWRLMLWVASRENEGWLRKLDIEQFPCRDLRTIDQLWLQHSNGRFGFSVQKRIYDEVRKSYILLANHVGWRVNGDWLEYEDCSFELRAPVGHLPWRAEVWWPSQLRMARGGSFFAPRLVDCNL
ncbi:MAG: GUN4 domain-containing protein [Spirulina sp. SIO3F2]|nr:GUN4 domain-containing protein [Spirulina sp. SIO3F2]